jgi:hypothetical protein
MLHCKSSIVTCRTRTIARFCISVLIFYLLIKRYVSCEFLFQTRRGADWSVPWTRIIYHTFDLFRELDTDEA